MVVDHWFWKIDNVLEAIDITSDAAKIRQAAFQLEGESKCGGTELSPLDI